jgi:hypothetical protein
MDPDRELMTGPTRQVSVDNPTHPMPDVCDVVSAGYLTKNGPPSPLEVAARKALDRAAAETGSGDRPASPLPAPGCGRSHR